ncbi:MAG: DUF5320 domain-containing protein [Desulfobacterales bacterium]|nr:MAG: DUF5320 domain-containing protein [Desulfobacterales bacterium]
MPRGDRTGPVGMGPMSGRAAGYCAGIGVPGSGTYELGRGFAGGFVRSFGGGRGRCHRFYSTGLPGWKWSGGWGATPWGALPPESEKKILAQRAEALQTQLDHIRQRLEQIGEPTAE